MFTPYITEKTIDLAKRGIFTMVAPLSIEKLSAITKIEHVFNVHIQSARVIKKQPKQRRVGRRTGYSPRVKKILVSLKKGEKIPGFDITDEKDSKKSAKK